MLPQLPRYVVVSRSTTSIRILQTARALSFTPTLAAGTQNSRPGWKGRDGDDHVVNRKPLDVQADASHQAMKEKQSSSEPHEKEGGQGVSEKDDGNHNKRAKEDHPEAPEPVIGMNSERGAKGH